jgi:cytochrome c553
MGRVAALGCVLCKRLGYGATPSVVHHLRTGIGKAQKASDFLTIALCPTCHDGQGGFHKGQERLRIAGVAELDLLADTIAEIAAT